MDIDPQKLLHDRLVAAMTAVNAENRIRHLVNTLSLITGLESLELDLAPYQQAAREFGEALDSLAALNTRAKELGVQP